jgi:hypothetical protein
LRWFFFSRRLFSHNILVVAGLRAAPLEAEEVLTAAVDRLEHLRAVTVAEAVQAPTRPLHPDQRRTASRGLHLLQLTSRMFADQVSVYRTAKRPRRFVLKKEASSRFCGILFGDKKSP